MAIRQAGSTIGFRALSVLHEVHAMSVKPRTKRKVHLVQPTFPVKFTDRDIEAIVSHISVTPKKSSQLGDILNDWAKHDLRKAFQIYPDKAIARGQLRAIRSVIKYAEGLRGALENFEKFDGSSWLVWKQIEGHSGEDYSREKAVQTRRLAEQRVFLQELESTAKAIEPGFKAGTDQRRNIASYLLLLDMEAIFKWLTGRRKATRGSNDRPTPFDDFVSVLWSVIFGNTQGMEAALRNWAKYTHEFRDRSALVANIDFRHPDWRLFDTV
jgi:hypothetical protein